jgi:hypothetical protein
MIIMRVALTAGPVALTANITAVVNEERFR